ncbi:MAG: EAL domain-containing protein, partial [Bacillota bacterium]|nr:EAL domain-containing protein [Bacillota bacterium]
EELLMYADTAMNKAKSEGKNSIRLYNRDIKHEVIKKIDMQNKLRKALELDEFFLQYQPQYSLKTGLIRGIEALVRWKSPSLGIVKPNDFIPVAEEMGYIVPLGKWALKKACCDAAKWEKEFGYTGLISVNVSARQLNNADFVETIREAIVTSGVNPKKLELEITESMFISSFETAVPKLADIIDLGARICLDDFGKGYSSLGYLMQLPIDTLKIDKSFIAHTETNMIKSNIAASIAALVNDLGIESIVEGVETEKQFEFIRHTRTNDLQGFLFSRPVNEDMIGEILERNNRGIPFNGVLKN